MNDNKILNVRTGDRYFIVKTNSMMEGVSEDTNDLVRTIARITVKQALLSLQESDISKWNRLDIRETPFRTYMLLYSEPYEVMIVMTIDHPTKRTVDGDQTTSSMYVNFAGVKNIDDFTLFNVAAELSDIVGIETDWIDEIDFSELFESRLL